MDVHHQVPSCCVLHYKTHMLLGLETSKEIDQERMPDAVHCLENPLLTHQAGEQNAPCHYERGKLAQKSHLNQTFQHTRTACTSFTKTRQIHILQCFEYRLDQVSEESPSVDICLVWFSG